jgi:hypothetical protein
LRYPEVPPLLEEFCSHFLACRPHRIVLTHLEELGRDEKELWDERHAGLVTAALRNHQYQGSVQSFYCGERIDLY